MHQQDHNAKPASSRRSQTLRVLERARYTGPAGISLRVPPSGPGRLPVIRNPPPPHVSHTVTEATLDDMPSLDNDCDTASENESACTDHTELVSTISSTTGSSDDDTCARLTSRARPTASIAAGLKLLQAATAAHNDEVDKPMHRWQESLDDPWTPLNMHTQES